MERRGAGYHAGSGCQVPGNRTTGVNTATRHHYHSTRCPVFSTMPFRLNGAEVPIWLTEVLFRLEGMYVHQWRNYGPCLSFCAQCRCLHVDKEIYS